MSVFDNPIVFRAGLEMAGATLRDIARALPGVDYSQIDALREHGGAALSPENRVRLPRVFAEMGVFAFRLPLCDTVHVIGAPGLITVRLANHQGAA